MKQFPTLKKKQNSTDQHPSEDEKPSQPSWKSLRILLWLFLAILLVPWFFGLLGEGATSNQINYSTFREQLRQGNIEEVTITGERIQGTLQEPLSNEVASEAELSEGETEFFTYLPSFGDEQLLTLLEEQAVAVTTQPEMDFSWLDLLISLLPLLLIVGIIYVVYSRMQSRGQGLFSIGKNQAKLYDQEQGEITFSDIAGLKGAKTELQEIIAFLKNPEQIHRLGGEAPTGVLLVGPPGTGKTLLARAVAGEANVPFFSISGSDFMEMLVGVGASRVRNLFQDAKEAGPSIIFIDEIDSIGRRRGAGLGGGHDEREQTLNQLLSELDGFEPTHSVIVMAATNRPDILDPALLRPGRFDRRITVDLPPAKHRVDILKIHALNKPLADNIDLKEVARSVPGFSGADLKNMLNEAALLAARESKEIIELDDIEEARDKILMGLEREGLVLTDEECKLIAYHEAGHALVAAIVPHADPIHKVTIVPRGRAMGVTQQLPEKEKYVYPKEYLLDRLAVMMGGRAAEDLIFETATSGAENDLKQATQLARKMVLEWGMSDKFSRIAWSNGRDQVFLGEEIAQRRGFSEKTGYEVDTEVKNILETAYDRAARLLRRYQSALSEIAETLLDQEEMLGQKVDEIVEKNQQNGLKSSHNGQVVVQVD